MDTKSTEPVGAAGTIERAPQLLDQTFEHRVDARPVRCVDRGSPQFPPIDQRPSQDRFDQLQVKRTFATSQRFYVPAIDRPCRAAAPGTATGSA